MFSPSILRPLWRCTITFCLALAAMSAIPLRAVVDGSGFNTADPGSNISNWTSGWPGAGLSGWNYVGQVNGASGIYLGNGWVITVAHVGVGNFTLGGVSYTPVSGSVAQIDGGSVDIILFQVASPPALPSLVLGQRLPVPFSTQGAGDAVAMIGYGGGHGETWGLNTVTGINVPVLLSQFSNLDFYTNTGTVTIGSQSVTNNVMAVSGDSGGAGFVFNAFTGKWELAGLMEAVSGGTTYFVQIGTYVQKILDITGFTASPVIVGGPNGQTAGTGSTIALTVVANGSSPLTYQWFKNSVAISGATSATLTIANASENDSGVYSVTVTNSDGSVTSPPASVVVSVGVPASPPWGLLALILLLFVTCSGRLESGRR